MSQENVVVERGRETGSPSSRRMRREGRLPAVVYGKDFETASISCDARELRAALSNRVVKGALLTIVLDGKPQLVQVQAVQRHPVRRDVAHVDFMAMRAGEVVTASVNLEVGVGVEGIANAIEVLGEASKMPAVIMVEASMANEGGEIAAGSLVLPKGMSLVTEPETLVARLAEDS